MFDAPVDVLSGVKDARKRALAHMGIYTVRDLLNHFPRRYMDLTHQYTIAEAPLASVCTILAQVHEVKLKQPRPRLSLVEITLTDGSGVMIVTLFQQPWLTKKIHPGMVMAVSGTLEFNYGYKRMVSPLIEYIDNPAEWQGGKIISVHPATESIPPARMRALMEVALDAIQGIDDPIPTEIRVREHLMNRFSALRAMHFPQSMEELDEARRRLAFEEVLMLQLSMKQTQALQDTGAPHRHVEDSPTREKLLSMLPFTLTDEQKRALSEISAELALDHRANHLVLGDVGTGKTILAACAIAQVHDSHTQALMMGPTEVLARQYEQKLGPLFDQVGIGHGLITASTPPHERAILTEQFAQGALTVLFGTHALLEPDVVGHDVSLVIIDEQQRFGVAQRDALRAKGNAPDYLSLTATPIPRSLARAVLGDMTLSYIHARPHATSPTTTTLFNLSNKGDAYDVAREAIERGEQVYIVCPLVGVEDDADKDTKDTSALSRIHLENDDDFNQDSPTAAKEHARYLAEVVFPNARVGLMYGKQKSAQKMQVMQDFRDHALDVLVSTTVIEVGVDVPNATVMIIEDADRFGLSQLHQLRGRVGRGEKPGYVCLISRSKAPDALDRLHAMETISDGFELAEYDLSLRREGDLLGSRQSGSQTLKLVRPLRDKDLIERAHEYAESICRDDRYLTNDEHKPLAFEITQVFGREEAGK